ncbi:MAG: hypothetical protein GY863_11265 [bacterium]|nr:hypothetical protein [bacterium]
MTTLWDNIKKGLMDSAKMAKEGAHIAAEKAEELGKKSKIMIDISNIKRKIEKDFTELGGKVYHIVQEEKVKDVSGNEEVQALMASIKDHEDELDIKHKEMDEISVAIKAEQEARKHHEDDEAAPEEAAEDTKKEETPEDKDGEKAKE